MNQQFLLHDSNIFSPGYYLQQYLENQKISQKEFSKLINISEAKMNKIINGDIALDNETINKLSNALGTSKELWRNLEKQYEDKLIKNRGADIYE